ncbi:TauD/TfdA dioxygenase family protein [Aquimarina aquimarini]|uniref:TauD/TfdA dioxygenase family protein n=1 Tax=Aquimarina aquimarini TaxID=1191734 RepID=UPI000D56090C|nr:TauD/TfdA family dioxygenase [Aquimarina aquimarini]
MKTQQMINIKDAEKDQIGAVITNLDVVQLEPESEEIGEILSAIYRNKLIVIKGQNLDPKQYVDFTKKLGTPQIYLQENYHHPNFPEIFVSSNVNKPGEKVGVAGTGHYWHTDCQFQEQPLSFTAITPVIIPETVRSTSYIDMNKVYKNLPEDLKTLIENKILIHGGNNRYKVTPDDIDKSIQQLIEYQNKTAPPVKHPAIIEHPVTGDKILYASSGFTMKVEGMNHEESEQTIKRLFDFIEKEEHIHTHHWDKGDLIIWDNRYLLHKSSALPVGEKSKSYRIGIYDKYPFYKGISKNS